MLIKNLIKYLHNYNQTHNIMVKINDKDITYIDNHNSNTNMGAVYRMLNNIKKGRRTIEEYLDFYLK